MRPEPYLSIFLSALLPDYIVRLHLELELFILVIEHDLSKETPNGQVIRESGTEPFSEGATTEAVNRPTAACIAEQYADGTLANVLFVASKRSLAAEMTCISRK
jgi:hypothetical protein